jgi:toxin ParE1/3/4
MQSRNPLRLELSLPAQDDLRDIAQYTFTHYGEQQMDTYLQSLYDGMELLTQNPKMGNARDDLPAGYEALNVENHVLIFTVRGNAIIIARILHQSRDIKRHM